MGTASCGQETLLSAGLPEFGDQHSRTRLEALHDLQFIENLQSLCRVIILALFGCRITEIAKQFTSKRFTRQVIAPANYAHPP